MIPVVVPPWDGQKGKVSKESAGILVLCIIMCSEKLLNSISESETFRIIFITKNSYELLCKK